MEKMVYGAAPVALYFHAAVDNHVTLVFTDLDAGMLPFLEPRKPQIGK